jgi:hypothetical protein
VNLEELFQSPIVQYPVRYTGDFTANLRRVLEGYCQEISAFGDAEFAVDVSQVVRDCGGLVTAILESLDAHLNGSPFEAFRLLSQGLEAVRPCLLSDALRTTIRPSYLGFYRIRTIRGGDLFSCDDVFHVPFTDRTKVGPERFSIPGYPCLYLGSSSLICWQEKGEPSRDRFLVVRYETWDALDPPILFLAYHPQRIAPTLHGLLGTLHDPERKYGPRALSSILTAYPLVLSCHFLVQHEDLPFKPEYVVPQLVLQWLSSETDVGGLCYLSAQAGIDQTPPPLSLNYVFPVPSAASSPDKYQMFRQRFHSSRPFLPTDGNIEANLKRIQPGNRYFDHHGMPGVKPYSSSLAIQDGSGRQPFETSAWGRLDQLLQNSVMVDMSVLADAARKGPVDILERRETNWI